MQNLLRRSKSVFPLAHCIYCVLSFLNFSNAGNISWSKSLLSSSYNYPAQGQTDYYAHVSRMARAPSVLTDIPHYGKAMFNNKPAQLNGAHQGQQQHRSTKSVGSVVEVTETVAQCDGDGNCMVVQDRIDVDADDYIQQKHKGFEVFKWKTFKPRY